MILGNYLKDNLEKVGGSDTENKNEEELISNKQIIKFKVEKLYGVNYGFNYFGKLQLKYGFLLSAIFSL